MALRINQTELNKLLRKGKKIKDGSMENEKSSKRNYNDRLNDAIELLQKDKVTDKVYFNDNNTKCMLEFNDIKLLSLNDCLRIGSRRLSRYKVLWHERVKNLVTKDVLYRWGDSKNEKLIIEFLYEVTSGKFMDYDGRVSAFKSTLDGLTHSGIIFEDSEEFIPMIFGKQKKSKTNKQCLKVIISVEKDPDRFFSKEFLEIINN